MKTPTSGRRLSRLVILWLMTAMLLLAQGIRICIHSADGELTDKHQASSSHIEVGLLADEMSDAADDNAHTSLSAILKDVQAKLSFFVVLALLLAVVPLGITRRLLIVPESASSIRLGWRLTPPLRAPPR